jgi:hypothetical protein
MGAAAAACVKDHISIEHTFLLSPPHQARIFESKKLVWAQNFVRHWRESPARARQPVVRPPAQTTSKNNEILE